MARIAFYAPLKPPDHPTPSGDRRIARLFVEALGRAGGRRVPCCLLNDADAAVRAECWVGAARRAKRVAMVTLGSGVGCGLVIDGAALEPGSRGGCLEGGHMIVGGLDGRPCPCGSRGRSPGPSLAPKSLFGRPLEFVSRGERSRPPHEAADL